MCSCVCTCLNACIRIHTYVYTHINTHIHTHTPVLLFKDDVVNHEVYVRDNVIISEDQTLEYCFEVLTDSDFIATLVWTDVASTPEAVVNLVHDLDLYVRAADGRFYAGNERTTRTESYASIQVRVFCVFMYVHAHIHTQTCTVTVKVTEYSF
jgi:hypothetical protein